MGVAFFRFNKHRLHGQYLPLLLLIDAAGNQHHHADDATVQAVVEDFCPNDRILPGQRSAAEVLHLLVQAFCHLTDLAPGEVLNLQATGWLIHFSG